jgi:hypothetical protein
MAHDSLADSDDSDKEVTSTTLLADDLMAFQHDLTSLRKLAHSLRRNASGGYLSLVSHALLVIKALLYLITGTNIGLQPRKQ